MDACDKPPPGWQCSREAGHDGPCAAEQVAVENDHAPPVALPWYKSQTIVGIIAAIILTVAQRFGLLGEITQDELIQALFVILPMIVALWGRLNTTRPVVTATAAKARKINQAVKEK